MVNATNITGLLRPPLYARVRVLLLFYFRPSSGAPSIPIVIAAKTLILPMKSVVGI
jgi:hypothetical protein